MRDRICLFILLTGCLSSVLAYSQVAGIRAGLNLSDQRYRIEGQRTSDDTNARLSFHIGIQYEKQIGSQTGVLGELYYSAEGASSPERQMKLNYLVLPISYYYEWPSGLRILGGPVFSYLLNARANSHGFASDRRDAYENFVFSLGLGADYLISPGLRIGVRYNRGISDFLNRDFYSFDLRSHTDTLQLYLAWIFKIM